MMQRLSRLIVYFHVHLAFWQLRTQESNLLRAIKQPYVIVPTEMFDVVRLRCTTLR